MIVFTFYQNCGSAIELIAEGRRKKEEGRRKKEEVIIAMVSAIENVRYCHTLTSL
ncbi:MULTISPECIES: hypothetical protein [unclassified Microcoleus]|uniref:hypothetical protein n=1 Tax=unclassified Microcoleus TaxID=2642155 RepID=UPI0025FED7B9|nr:MULTISPECIES: hypothetical protein [unclassified Microcoleus]